MILMGVIIIIYITTIIIINNNNNNDKTCNIEAYCIMYSSIARYCNVSSLALFCTHTTSLALHLAVYFLWLDFDWKVGTTYLHKLWIKLV